jgi:hypothetical protein
MEAESASGRDFAHHRRHRGTQRKVKTPTTLRMRSVETPTKFHLPSQLQGGLCREDTGGHSQGAPGVHGGHQLFLYRITI